MLNESDILDLGCGGGLICEPLARLKANVTGVDFVEQNINIAKKHAKTAKLKINYLFKDIDLLNINKKFDIILLLEVLEHLDNWEYLILKVKSMLKKNGYLIISTINRNSFSKLFAIFLAENILNWVPKKTHDFNKLIKPEELKKTLEKNNFTIKNISGMNYNPLARQWKLNSNIHLINYFCVAKLS